MITLNVIFLMKSRFNPVLIHVIFGNPPPPPPQKKKKKKNCLGTLTVSVFRMDTNNLT